MIIALAAAVSVAFASPVVGDQSLTETRERDINTIDKCAIDMYTATTPAEPFADSANVWSLVWDDTIDGGIIGVEKTCQVDLQIRNGTVVGVFVGPGWGRCVMRVSPGHRLIPATAPC